MTKEQGRSVAANTTADPETGRRRPNQAHRFFLNPYNDVAFTRCPKCEAGTRIRKFPLVIHIDPAQLFILNKECRYCVNCDLIIVRQSELEQIMAVAFDRRDPGIVGNEYLVVGTITRQTWRVTRGTPTPPADALERTQVFREVWNFTVNHGGWSPRENK